MAATVPTLVATKNMTIKLRISEADLRSWRNQAKIAGLPLAVWVRNRCAFNPEGIIGNIMGFDYDDEQQVTTNSQITHEMIDREAAKVYPQFARKR